MQHDNSTQFSTTEDRRNADMGAIMRLMQLGERLMERLEELHDLACLGELSHDERDFWILLGLSLEEKLDERWSH
jgi:hypothetical protein